MLSGRSWKLSPGSKHYLIHRHDIFIPREYPKEWVKQRLFRSELQPAMKTTNQYISNVSAQAIGRIFSMGANFVVFILVARFLGTEIFGQFSYILTFLGLCVVIAEFGTNSILARDLSQLRDSAETYWGNFLVLRIGLSLLVMIPSIAVAYFVRQDLLTYLLAGSLSLPFLASRFFEPIFQVYHRPWFSMYSFVAYGLVYLSFSIVILFITKALLPIMLAYIGANVIYGIVAFSLAFILLKPKFTIKWTSIKKILTLSAPIGISALFIIINTRADIFMLAHMKSDYEVGIYNAAFRFLEMAAIIAVILMNPAIPIFSDKAINDREALREDFIKIIEFLAIVTIPIAIFLPHFSPLLIKLLFGEGFSESAEVLNILAWVGVLVFYSLFGSALCVAMGVLQFEYWSAASAASINILLNYLWIPKYSFTGSAWATLLCEVFLVSITFFYIMKNLGNIIRWDYWLKILGVNIVLYMLSGFFWARQNWIILILALIIYVILILVMKLFPRDVLSFIIPWEKKVQFVKR